MKLYALFVAVFFHIDHQTSLQNYPFLKSCRFCPNAAAKKFLLNLIAVPLLLRENCFAFPAEAAQCAVMVTRLFLFQV